jgi:hypothetical protein
MVLTGSFGGIVMAGGCCVAGMYKHERVGWILLTGECW